MGLHLPNCIRCDAAQKLVTTIAAFDQRPEVQVLECSNCGRLEMYFVINGALQRW
jgi:transcription elongation factor Elf1